MPWGLPDKGVLDLGMDQVLSDWASVQVVPDPASVNVVLDRAGELALRSTTPQAKPANNT